MNLTTVLVADQPECLALAAEAFPDYPAVTLRPADLTPPAPFEGRLFAILEEVAAASRSEWAVLTPESGTPAVGLVVPAAWHGEAQDGRGGTADAGHSRPVVAVPHAVLPSDHVNLVARGPLTGRWPADRPRAFPSVSGIYRRPDGEAFADAEEEQEWAPASARLSLAGPVYSLVVAGVADAERLTPFERRQMRRCGLRVAASLLVPSVIVAAYYGLAVAAVLAPRPAKSIEWK